MENVKIIRHYEGFLGEVISGANQFEENENWGFSISKFTGGIYRDVASYATIGLSEHLLEGDSEHPFVRHEIFFMTYEKYGDMNFFSLLHQIASFLIEKNAALLLGQVLEAEQGNLFRNSELNSFYIRFPYDLPEQFAMILNNSNEPVWFFELIPIHDSEKKFIKNRGWEVFESYIRALKPDFFDIYRKSIV